MLVPTVTILYSLAFEACADGLPESSRAKSSADTLIDTLLDRLPHRALSAPFAHLDETALEKPGQLATLGGPNTKYQAMSKRLETHSLDSCTQRAVTNRAIRSSTTGLRVEKVTPETSGDTNEVVRTVNGIRHKRLGNSGLVVSEVALGTQRWGGADFNSPDQSLCHRLLDIGIENGINLVDTAEQYPIPSGPGKPEGRTEEIIGNWLRQDKSRRDKIVIATKITGGDNVTPENIVADLEDSLRRLGTDYVDIYLLHWPARYTPQANWGQSLEYDWEYGKVAVPYATSFHEIVETMGNLVKQGKIRGYGSCNDNVVGLLGMADAARELGVPGPCAMQNDYSILNRRIEEQGLSEASSPALTNTGFLAYNALAGGMLTGKYADAPAAVDDPNPLRASKNMLLPRGRMDDMAWGSTLGRYRTSAAREAQAKYAELAKEFGMSPTELALRFVASREAVTSCLLGHTSVVQLEECLDAFRQPPLPDQLKWEIDRVHLENRMPLFSNTKTRPNQPNQGKIGERIP